MLEALAGKRQGQILAATINNFDAARNAMESTGQSAGSANAEMQVAMDSIEFRLNKMSQVGTSIAQNLFQRDDIKAVIDVLTSLAEAIQFVTDKLGLFGTIGLGAGIFAGFKNVGRGKILPLLFCEICRHIQYVLSAARQEVYLNGL